MPKGAPSGGGSASGSTADAITYDPTTSGLAADNVQAAVDEVQAEIVYGAGQLTQAQADIVALQARKGVWTLVDTDHYSPTPNSVTTLSFNDTTGLHVGMPLRLRQNAAWIWYQIVGVDVDTLVTLAGPDLGVSNVDGVAIGSAGQLVSVSMFVGGTYADGVESDLLLADMARAEYWFGASARVVRIAAWHLTEDSGIAPVLNLSIDHLGVPADVLAVGLSMGASNTQVWNVDGDIQGAANRIQYGDRLLVSCTTAGGTGDAVNLMVTALCVIEE